MSKTAEYANLWKEQSTKIKKSWSGTFDEYLDLVKQNPKITRNAFQRMFDMIEQAGTEEYSSISRDNLLRYKFFDDKENGGADAVFGLDEQLMKFVNVIKAASLGYGPEKRVILLHGPVGSAKSTICRILKKGLESYSITDEGALYTFDWVDEAGKHPEIFGEHKVYPSPMNEEPLLLIPEDLRSKVEADLNKSQDGDFRIKIKGELCPPSRFIFKKLMEIYDNDLSKVLSFVRVKRMFLSEADRVGIGTFQPKDEKNQDSTELTGDINYKKIAEYGSDSDPRAFNFDGEFNVANRGMIEFVEVLKLDVAFLYDLLGASQEHRIKPKKFAQTHIDEVIIGHTNEPEYRRLQDNEFMEALRDRTVKIDIPYITTLKEEINIYKRDFNSQKLRGVTIAPHTIEMAAMWGLLTRIEKPNKANLTRIQKLKLYNGKSVPGYTEDNLRELRENTKREGLEGISPRYIQDKISNAIIEAQRHSKGCVNPFMVFKELEEGLKHHSLISKEELKGEYRELLDQVKKEYEEIIKAEVQQAISADTGALQRMFSNYIDQIKAYTQKERIRNSFTGADEAADEHLMRSIEEKIEIPESRKDDFRREIMNYVGAMAVEGRKFTYTSNERLQKAIELKLFQDQKDSIKLSTLVSAATDKDTQEKIDIVKTRLIKDFGYDETSATDVLHYVSSIFARGDTK